MHIAKTGSVLAVGCFSSALASQTAAQSAPPARVSVEFSGDNKASGATVTRSGDLLRVQWPASASEVGSAVFNLEEGAPAIESLGITPRGKALQVLGRQLNPVTLLTVGERDLKPSGWVAFFDNPPRRPYRTHVATLTQKRARVSSQGTRTTISIGELEAGPFRGEMRFTFYAGSPLMHAEAALTTQQDGRAILYDAGLTSEAKNWRAMTWRDPEGRLQSAPVSGSEATEPLGVSGRALAAESESGSLTVFPAPHQFFFPLDEAFNLKFTWKGRSYGALQGYGFGIRQAPEGDRRYVPWFNAPPGTVQKIGVFYLLSAQDGEKSLAEVARYTNGDKYRSLPGHKTYSSHFHIEHTLELKRRQREENTTGIPQVLEAPGFVKTLKARGVDIVHLAEFHEGNTPAMKASERLPLLKALHSECERLSDAQLLVLPGEEPNVHLGGHWLSLFPRPVYWVLNREAQQPFLEEVAGYGKVYHVGSPADVLRLMQEERGLMWTAHPRIKASLGFPDRYRASDFFRSDRFLGGAWKAMPADLSRPTLGWRVLELADDMANWGHKKYTPAEADLFRMEPVFETYAHLNVNYLKLDAVPRFSQGWQPILDALSSGKFFSSTGEVLIPEFTIGGKSSGETLDTRQKPVQVLEAKLSWSFPMSHAVVVSGDGQKTHRQRIDLSDTQQFGERTLRVPLDLAGKTWARLEAWDIAANGAYTPPVWFTTGRPSTRSFGDFWFPGIGSESALPSTGARYVPERQDDFAWENDLVAFRTYGPAIKPGAEDSGVDVWSKRVPTPIIDKWYAGEKAGVSYHQDHGEGLDEYDVGNSRGCGGTAIWKGGRMYLSGPYKTWKVISSSREKSVFELAYVYDVEGEKIDEVKRVTIELGQRLFRSESTFTKNGQPAALDVAVGITTHEGKAKPTFNRAQGWMSCWEKLGGGELGTGVAIAPSRIAQMQQFQTPGSNQSHALLITRTDAAGKTLHFAGYGWSKAGAITTPEAWHKYLSEFAAGLR